jgi:hypothetical protein
MNCYLRQVWTRGKIENVHQVGSERCNLFISLSLLFSTFRLPRLHFSTCLVSTFRPSYILFTSELFSSLLSDLPTLHFSTLLFSSFRLPYPLLLYFLHFPTFRLPWSSLSTFFTALVFRLPCSSLLYLLPSPLFFYVSAVFFSIATTASRLWYLGRFTSKSLLSYRMTSYCV